VINAGAADNLCCQRLDRNRMWVGDDDGRLWYSLDGGLTWEERAGWTGSGTGEVRALHFVNDYVGFMVHNSAAPVGTVLQTINGGYTWRTVPTPTNTGLNAIWAVDSSMFVVVGDDGVVLRGHYTF